MKLFFFFDLLIEIRNHINKMIDVNRTHIILWLVDIFCVENQIKLNTIHIGQSNLEIFCVFRLK